MSKPESLESLVERVAGGDKNTTIIEVHGIRDSVGQTWFTLIWWDQEYHAGPQWSGQGFRCDLEEWIRRLKKQGKQIQLVARPAHLHQSTLVETYVKGYLQKLVEAPSGISPNFYRTVADIVLAEGILIDGCLDCLIEELEREVAHAVERRNAREKAYYDQ